MKQKKTNKATLPKSKKDKTLLKKAIIERATREYFLDKMHKRLSRAWKTNSLHTPMNKETLKRYQLFEDKIDKLNDQILRLVPIGTHYSELQFRITDM